MLGGTEQQQVTLVLIDESEESSLKKVKQTVKMRRPWKNYCVEDYIVGYGVPILIVILILAFFVLAFIAVRRYNQNCSHTKGASCRGLMWYFT